MVAKKARVIAFYLPQYHPIPQNDRWWGKGFTEWTNVGKARPLFRGHYQPKVPADLGYYDLRLPEIRQAQAQMAEDAGIEGFMYWHYWFGNGETILEQPFKEVLESGQPNFPFCLGWANHSWENKTWQSDQQYNRKKLLIEQLYPGEDDYADHFYHILPALKDTRYITIDGKPLFLIFSPLNIPDIKTFFSVWQRLAIKNGLKGIHFVGQTYLDFEIEMLKRSGFDSICRDPLPNAQIKVKGKYMFEILRRIRNLTSWTPLNKYNYATIIKNCLIPELDKDENIFPTVVPNFDHSPRSGKKGLILHNSTPQLFQTFLRNTVTIIQNKTPEHRIIFLRSWNEWGEGNYVEPDLKYGSGYLDSLKNEIFETEAIEKKVNYQFDLFRQ